MKQQADAGRFGEAAHRLAGLVPRVLGWRPHEFWQATPAELVAILQPGSTEPASMSRQDLNHLMERDGNG